MRIAKILNIIDDRFFDIEKNVINDFFSIY